MSLRIVLLGTGEFALPSFRAIIESEHDVLAIYTQPDRTGRGHHRHVNPARVLADENHIPVRQPEQVNDSIVLDELRSFAADVFIVAAYGQILKPEFLAIPPLGTFNLHGSLLPRHRGAAPVQYSIWKGDHEGGVTMFQIEPALDSGPMVGRVATPIGAKETSGELMQRLANMSGTLTLEVMSRIADGTAVFEPQDDELVTLAPKIRKQDGFIDWSRSAAEIDCHVRAMQPWPKASTWLYLGDTKLRCILIDVEPLTESTTVEPGTVANSGKHLTVATGSGMLQVNRIQPEGKQSMDAIAFMNGYRVATGFRFGW
ncbi:MAG: methionyl-tRNA formyltransferase [Fuerstiella sp.]|nr:methionyl-tRNA formyltransferase [Fuerstiella sp.]